MLPPPSVLWLAFQGASMHWPIPAQACVRICMKMHSIRSRFIIRLGNILLAATHVCTSQPGNFTGCGSEGIKNSFFWISSLHYFPINEPLTKEELSSTTGLCCLFTSPLSGMPVCSIINRNPLQLNSCVRGYFGVFFLLTLCRFRKMSSGGWEGSCVACVYMSVWNCTMVTVTEE